MQLGPKQKADFLAKTLTGWSQGLKDYGSRARTLADMDQSLSLLSTMVSGDTEMARALTMLKEWHLKAQTDPEVMAAKIAEYGSYWTKKANEIK